MGTIPEMGTSLRIIPPTCCPRLLGALINWRGHLDQVPPALGIHLDSEGGNLQHLLFEPCAVVGVNLSGQRLQVLFGQSQGLAQVLDDALDRVGGDGPGQDGVVRPEVLMHPLDQLVPQPTGEVQIDVG